MSVQQPQTGREFGDCIYCGSLTAAGARVCSKHLAALHGEDPRPGGGPA